MKFYRRHMVDIVITSYSIHYTKLYDLRTTSAKGMVVFHASLLSEKRGLRITSYNVCYTKLLRALMQILSMGILLEISTDENRPIYTGIGGAGGLMNILYPILAGLLLPSLGFAMIFLLTSVFRNNFV